jgi:uncharacterized membrane protein
MSALYIGAGLNHFINPRIYIRIIPPYLPAPHLINYASGISEILLGILLLVEMTRHLAALGIIVMLVLFMLVHIYMLQQSLRQDHYLIAPTIAWLRLLLQPVLIAWAYWHT